jgi:peptidoglycan/xylan/chitin deacetylase (PgdA/CDA1 family)
MAEPIPILLYHSIANAGSSVHRRWTVTRDRFARQMRCLAEHGFRPITVSALAEAVSRRDTLPCRAIVLTFDDGYRDFLTEALPVLQLHGFPATLFVVTRYVGGTSGWLKDAAERDRPMLSWPEIRSLAESGVECGAHTHSHPQLDIISAADAYEEIYSSRCALEDRLGQAVLSFAYPHGYASRKTRRLVRMAGFDSACRVGHALSSVDEDPLGRSRVIITDDVDERELLHLVQGGLPIAPPSDGVASLGWRCARWLGRLMSVH